MGEITILIRNSQTIVWTKEQWDDYQYDGKAFIIIRGGSWVGVYNFDAIISVTVKFEEE